MRFMGIVALFITLAVPWAAYAQQGQNPTSNPETIEGTIIGTDGTKYWSGFKIESGGKEYTFVTEYYAKQGTNPTIVGGKCCEIGTKVKVTYIGSLTRYLLNVTRVGVINSGTPAMPTVNANTTSVPKPMATPQNVSSKPVETTTVGATITPIIVGKSIRFPSVKLSSQANADKINKYLKDHYWNSDSDAKSSFLANLQSSYDEFGYKVVLNTPDILSIEISYSQYRAGDITQHHFDLSTGDAITLDQIIEPSKLNEIKQLVCADSKKRLVQAKNRVIESMKDRRGGWNGGPELWYEKSIIDESYEGAFQASMKRQCSEIELEKKFTLTKTGIGFEYITSIGMPMSVRELEPKSNYFYPWAVVKPFLVSSRLISSLATPAALPSISAEQIETKTGRADSSVSLVKSGIFAIKPQFDSANDFSQGLAAVKIMGKYGYVDKGGKMVVAPRFDDALEFSEGLAQVGNAEKFGYINKRGRVVIALKFRALGDICKFREGLAPVIDDCKTKWGYMDKTGRIVITPQFDSVGHFSDGFAEVRIGDYNNGKSGYIDKTGRIVINPKFDLAGGFQDGLAPVRMGDDKTGKWGYINKAGNMVIKPQFDFAYWFSEGLAPVRMGDDKTGKWGYINKAGNMVIKPQFDLAYWFNEGLAAVKMGDDKTVKWGYIDKTGKVIIIAQFDQPGLFSEGLVPVRTGDEKTGKWGYIDKSGKMVIAIQFDAAFPFSEGLARVRIGDDKTGKWGYIYR